MARGGERTEREAEDREGGEMKERERAETMPVRRSISEDWEIWRRERSSPGRPTFDTSRTQEWAFRSHSLKPPSFLLFVLMCMCVRERREGRGGGGGERKMRRER